MLRKYGIWGMGLLLAGVLAYGFFTGGFPDHGKSGPKAPSTQPKAEATQQDLQIKVTPRTEIIQKVKYTKCGDEEVLRETAGEKLVGLTYQQFQQAHAGWTIETFDTKEIVRTMTVDGYCKFHTDNMFLGVHNGHVAIFYGKPGLKALLKEETNIPLQEIRPQDRTELEQGIVVKDRSELLHTLEGLQEHR